MTLKLGDRVQYSNRGGIKVAVVNEIKKANRLEIGAEAIPVDNAPFPASHIVAQSYTIFLDNDKKIPLSDIQSVNPPEQFSLFDEQPVPELSPIVEKQTIVRGSWLLYRTKGPTARQNSAPVFRIGKSRSPSDYVGEEVEQISFPSDDGEKYLFWLSRSGHVWCEESQIVQVSPPRELYIYGMSRSSGYGTCPEGYTVNWDGAEGLDKVAPEFLEMTRNYYYELVAYPRKLTDEECKRFEMRPISNNTHKIQVGDWVHHKDGHKKYPAIVLRHLLNWNVEVELRTHRGNFTDIYQEDELEHIETSVTSAIVAAQTKDIVRFVQKKKPSDRGNYHLPNTPDVIYLPPPIIYLPAAVEALRNLSQIDNSSKNSKKKCKEELEEEKAKREKMRAKRKERAELDSVAITLGYSQKDRSMMQAFHAIGMDDFWRGVNDIFENMMVVEQQIDLLVAQYWEDDRDLAARIFGAFMYCKSEFPLNALAMKFHASEMLQRVIDDAVSDALSDMELFSMLVKVGDEHGLNREGFDMYLHLMRRYFPYLAKKYHPDEIAVDMSAAIETHKSKLSYPHEPIAARLPTGQRLKSIIG